MNSCIIVVIASQVVNLRKSDSSQEQRTPFINRAAIGFAALTACDIHPLLQRLHTLRICLWDMQPRLRSYDIGLITENCLLILSKLNASAPWVCDFRRSMNPPSQSDQMCSLLIRVPPQNMHLPGGLRFLLAIARTIFTSARDFKRENRRMSRRVKSLESGPRLGGAAVFYSTDWHCLSRFGSVAPLSANRVALGKGVPLAENRSRAERQSL